MRKGVAQAARRVRGRAALEEREAAVERGERGREERDLRFHFQVAVGEW